MQNPALAPLSIGCSKRKMPNENNSTDEDRFGRQDQRRQSAGLFLVVVAIILIVIGIGFFMMLFTQRSGQY
jgi:hypothetical protein